jgi:hypothetical protein
LLRNLRQAAHAIEADSMHAVHVAQPEEVAAAITNSQHQHSFWGPFVRLC